MAKWSSGQRLISLMNLLSWREISSWDKIRKDLQSKEMMLFRAWLRKNIEWIVSPRAQDAIRQFYLSHETVDNSSGIAVYLREGRAALYAAYRKDQLYGGEE